MDSNYTHVELLAYIKELLLLNDCVIIPGFGGFISNYQPADFRSSYFTPPGKSVSFNKKLNFNDGMFINHVAGKEGISYFFARKKVNLLVEELNYRLTDGEEIDIPAIGTLKFDDHENLIFKPGISCNLNPDSFGLPSFHFKTLYSEKQALQPVAQRDRDAVQVIFQKRVLKKVLIAVPLVLALAVSPLKNNTDNLQSSNLVNLNTTMTMTRPVLLPETPAVAVVNEDTTTDEAVEAVKEEDHRFFVIGGSFREEENANTFLSQMKEKGYEARNLGIIKGLNYIALDSFASFDEACSAQKDFISKFPDSGVWIYVRK